MKRLLFLLTAAMVCATAGGCAYTAMTSDANGKIYLTRTNMGGLWNNGWVCDPNGGNLNCKPATVEGAAAAPAAGAAPAPTEAPAEAPLPVPAPEGGAGGEGGE